MPIFKNKYRIEPNRWKYWGYSAPGRYYITICSKNIECIFCRIDKGQMFYSELGEIVKEEIGKMVRYNKRLFMDESTVMPNHTHLLIELGDSITQIFNPDNGTITMIMPRQWMK